jgi:hypothetical protein
MGAARCGAAPHAARVRVFRRVSDSNEARAAFWVNAAI